MLTNEDSQGVSNCYVFKSRLQEYAQKVGLPTPVYETIKEGPSHQPSFRSTVIVNNIRYDSLPGFFNRKAAEQSAAEVALVELAKSDEVNQSITQPVIETGLCKNLLQEYAQKMNYAMPLYLCKKDERPARLSSYSCTVEIGGIRYIGASARTKKEAEIKAARTALLAIQSIASHSSEKQFGQSKLTVVPCRKRGAESVAKADETSKVPKSKKTRFKKRPPKSKKSGNKKGCNRIENAPHVGANINHEVESHANVNDECCFHTVESRPLAAEAMKTFDDGMPVSYQHEKGAFAGEVSLSLSGSKILENSRPTELQSNEFCVQSVESRPLAVEAMKNFDNGMSVDHQNEMDIFAGSKVSESRKSTEVQSNVSCVLNMESRPLAVETMKNFDDGMSIDYQNEMGTLAGEGSLSLNSNKVFENGKSTELQSNEFCVQNMESRPLAGEGMQINGTSVDYQNDKGMLAGEGSLPLNSSKISENRKSPELQSNESCFQIMKSSPLAAEAMNNFDDGMSVGYENDKITLAGEGSCEIFENGKSTELQPNESCVQIMQSRPLAADAMKNFDDGMSVVYQNEKGTLAGEGPLSLNSSKIFESGSTDLHSSENNPGTMGLQASVLSNGDTREMSTEVNGQQFNGDMGSVTYDCVVEASINICESNPLEEKIRAEANVN